MKPILVTVGRKFHFDGVSERLSVQLLRNPKNDFLDFLPSC